ncbi:hypothetical protein [Streptomyces hilarionis]|uniref:hypothetical protein n=1 Tax=Streptomyces hilarionis TaxID=2839954 RepID=UPI002119D774|nr:hypothetical protein [Streptomyces hilarionis]MCQ9134929.1 hypothetical protein [Streptomyces hilarionis]
MIQVHVSDQVLDDARDRQREGDPALSPAEARRIAKRLREGIGGLPPEEYREQLRVRLRDFAAAQDLDLPSPDTRSTFWSYQLENHPDLNLATGETLHSMHMAAAYTESQNAIVEDTLRYLEGTPGGKALGELHLWDVQVQNELKLSQDEGRALAYEAWGTLSEKYAATTENEALFFMAELNPSAVAYQTESRQLRQDGKLGIIEFMYPAPAQKYADLAPETQELLASQAVRAQIHTFSYDETDPKFTPLTRAGHLDLEELKALPTPEAQRAAVLEVCARVASLDGPARAADVERLVEEIKVLRPDHEVTLPGVEDREWAAGLRERTPNAPAAPAPVAVSTHGQYLPGVRVDARTGPAPLTPLAFPAAGAAAAHAHAFLPGVDAQAKSVLADRTDAPAAAPQAPPAPEQSRDTGREV